MLQGEGRTKFSDTWRRIFESSENIERLTEELEGFGDMEKTSTAIVEF